MFGCCRRKKVEEAVEEVVPEYRYDAKIRFNDGHIFTIEDAEHIRFGMGKRWLIAWDGEVETNINASQAEEVTITRRTVDA